MNFNLNVKSNLIISGQGFYLSSSLPFVTLNPNSEVQPHPADRVSSVPRGTCTPGWKQTARDSTLCWVYAQVCTHLGAPVARKLNSCYVHLWSLLHWVSQFPFRYSVLTFYFSFTFLSDFSAHNAFQIALHLNPVFTFNFWLLLTPHLPFYFVDSSPYFRSAVRPTCSSPAH